MTKRRFDSWSPKTTFLYDGGRYLKLSGPIEIAGPGGPFTANAVYIDGKLLVSIEPNAEVQTSANKWKDDEVVRTHTVPKAFMLSGWYILKERRKRANAVALGSAALFLA